MKSIAFARVSSTDQTTNSQQLAHIHAKEQAVGDEHVLDLQEMKPVSDREAYVTLVDFLNAVPALKQIVILASQRKFQRLWVYKWDRLSRSPIWGNLLVRELEKFGVKVESVLEGDNPLLRDIMFATAKNEMKTKQERIALGWEKNLSQGIIPARACYGLRKFVPRHTGQKKRLYWNEREIAVVKKVFALAAGGMHYTRIPQHLGLTDMAFGWATIKNPVYTGRYYDRHTKKWYRLKITPVIDDDTWLKVNAQIKSVNPRHIYPPWPNEAPA